AWIVGCYVVGERKDREHGGSAETGGNRGVSFARGAGAGRVPGDAGTATDGSTGRAPVGTGRRFLLAHLRRARRRVVPSLDDGRQRRAGRSRDALRQAAVDTC